MQAIPITPTTLMRQAMCQAVSEGGTVYAVRRPWCSRMSCDNVCQDPQLRKQDPALKRQNQYLKCVDAFRVVGEHRKQPKSNPTLLLKLKSMKLPCGQRGCYSSTHCCCAVYKKST